MFQLIKKSCNSIKKFNFCITFQVYFYSMYLSLSRLSVVFVLKPILFFFLQRERERALCRGRVQREDRAFVNFEGARYSRRKPCFQTRYSFGGMLSSLGRFLLCSFSVLA